ncbi:sphingosine kinase 1 [Thecamonas trahens ATCC 50062]|uniref:Sphingosine kinase 1 n=1 Tax=Thecamonas trahens ATCC 50062 TaxID=461836 RepID=A0A0L0D602_THETB|nr:sphingosine kinase 1 [Thecamonas trahens ATCC 50062]KNC47610.1 sphingosine kinase 1 [Thecamonas trahens ATCC 50062]|eukprot:XP_013759535.1 sphingosine kinase 1 [Thecamonas trahens ATCC 50062]
MAAASMSDTMPSGSEAFLASTVLLGSIPHYIVLTQRALYTTNLTTRSDVLRGENPFSPFGASSATDGTANPRFRLYCIIDDERRGGARSPVQYELEVLHMPQIDALAGGDGRSGVSGGALEATKHWVTCLNTVARDGVLGDDEPLRRSVLILVNPFGGKKKATQTMVDEVMPILLASGLAVDVIETQAQGHAVELARTVDLDAYDVIATASGDGLLHEDGGADGGRRCFDAVSLAVIPTGSGNALANSIGVLTAIDAAYTLVKGKPRRIDAMRLEQPEVGVSMHALVLFEWALVADVDYYSEQHRWMGDLRFDYEGLKRILKLDKYTADLSFAYSARYVGGKLVLGADGEPESGELALADEDFQIFALANCAYQAKTTQITPLAQVDDGTMDLAFVRSISRAQLLKFFTKVATGKHVAHPAIEYYKVTHLILDPQPKPGAKIGVDGEFIGYSRVIATVVPRMIPFLIVDDMLHAVVADSAQSVAEAAAAASH